MHVLSESASYDDAVTKYAWLKFTGSRGKEVSQRTHKRMIREGDVFGILPLRNGSRYTLIFPDIPHIDFPLDLQTGKFLLDRSSKLRKVPDVVKREGKVKTAGALTMERSILRTTFDTARFQPKKIPNEAVNGINFTSYQWRMVPQNDYAVQTTKGIVKFRKNDMIGVRFKRPGKGGVVVNTDGMYLKLLDEQYDKLVADTNIMPIQDWPEGNIDVDTVKAYQKTIKHNRRRSAVEEREAVRLANRANALEQKQQAKELARKVRESKQAESAELRDLRKKIKSGEIQAPVREIKTVYSDEPELRKRKSVRVIEHEELDEALDEELDMDMDLDLNEQKLEDIINRSPFAGDIFSIEDTVGSLFGGDDSHDEEHAPELDLSDIDEPEDDEEEPAPKSKVRSKKAKPPAEEVEEEEEPDAEEDPDDSDPDASDDEDGESADGSTDDDESVDDADADDTGDDEEDPDGEEEADDADASDAVDETGADEDGDSDVAAAEKEAAETAKKIAASNKSTPSDRATEAEEGDVLKFKADVKLQRDWLIVKMSTHANSDNIVVYTLYDITNSPDEVRQVRINRARKQNLFDYAEHIKDMAPKLFNKVYDMVEDYPVNKDPIAS